MDSSDIPAPSQAPALDGEEPASVPRKKRKVKKRRISTFWMKQIHTLHWMSSALCLVTMLLFAVTGFTLNHAADIKGDVETETVETSLPRSYVAEIEGMDVAPDEPVPSALVDWLEAELDVDLSGRVPEWSEDEIYIPMPRPGGDAWLAIDRATGDVVYENTDRGFISFLNDLHKGRDTGLIWSWFIDIFAFGCLFFALSGLLLLYIHSRFRSSTWPIVGAGLVLPLFIIVLFIHY